MMDTAQHKELNKLNTQNAIRDGEEVLDQMIVVLQRAAREIQRYKDRFQESEKLTEKASVLRWAIDHMSSFVLVNARLGSAASASADLVGAAKVAEIINAAES